MRHAKLRVSFKHLSEVLGLPKDTKILDMSPITNCPGGWLDIHVSGLEFMERPVAEPAIIEWPIKPGDRQEDW